MKLGIFFSVLILLFVQQCCYSENVSKNKELIYKFKSGITARNTASDKVIGKWTYSGKLIIQEFEDHKIFKLDKLKTNVFNGIRSNEKDAIAKEISEDKKIITEPFGVYIHEPTNVNITVLPEEDLWSINMKKAIASIFLIDSSVTEGYEQTEQILSGNCGVNIQVKNSENSKIITKTIDHYNCTDDPSGEWTNVQWATINNNHKSMQYATIRTYIVSPKTNEVTSIDSSANFTFQTSPDVKSNLHLDQHQYFELVSSSVDNVKHYDISNNTNIKNIIYEQDPSNYTETETQRDYIKGFENAYYEFEAVMKQLPLENLDVKIDDNINEMYNNLTKLNRKSLTHLSLGIFLKNHHFLNQMFLSLIPYVGTNNTVDLIKELVTEDTLNDLLLIKLLAIFPEYVNDIDEELLENCEVLLSLQKSVKSKEVKNAAVWSFASLVGEGIRRNTISEELAEKYVNKIYNRYLKVEKHENEMKYILALINVANGLDTGTIMNILDNPNESRHIKALAMYGFKHRLIDLGDEVFVRFWPLVKNATEDFEVRVAALDLILSCEISEEQFNEVVNYYDKEHDNPHDEHLANYVFSSIHSLQNTTGYYYHLGDWATARLQQGNTPRYSRSWTTGNYRLAFTDENANFGASLQTRLVANPVTNAINVIQLTFDDFAMSLKLDQYHLYVKIEGVLDTVFVQEFINERPNDEVGIAALLELIQRFKYKMKEGADIFIDFVLFSDNRVLFGMHINQHNIENYTENPLFVDLLKLLVSYNSVSFPIIDNIGTVSDLGTHIEITYDKQQVIAHDVDDAEKLFDDDEEKKFTLSDKMLTTMTLDVSTKNPLADIELDVYKVHYDLKSLVLPLTLNTSCWSLSWTNKNDTFNWVMDSLIGTSASNETILQEYCPKCNEYEEIPVGEAASRLLSVPMLGLQFNITGTKESEEMTNLRNMNQFGVNSLTHVVNTHQSNAFAFPLAKPLLYYLHLISYYRYLDRDLSRLSARTVTLYDEPYKSELHISYNGDNVYNNNDPFDGSSLNASFEFVNKRIKDEHVLNSINATFEMLSSVKTNDGQSKSSVEHKFEVYADVLESEKVKKKFCLNYKVLYPDRRSDKLSLEPVHPAKAKATISWDKVNSFEDKCPPYFLKLTEISKATEQQNRKAKEMKEYKICTQESEGLKYIPPTKSCTAAHKALSVYSDYTVYLEMLNGGERPSVEATDESQLENNKIFEYYHEDDGHINVSISKGFLKMFEIDAKPELLNYVETSTFVDFLSADATVEVYDDYDVELGQSSTCDITSKQLKTFNGEYKKIFEDTPPKDIVAFVECFAETRSGLTVHKIDNKTIIFKYWSGDNVVLTNIKNGKLKVLLNGKEKLKSDTEQVKEDMKIYFLEDDIIYVRSPIVEIYYTTESISIKSSTIFNNYICGQCSYKDEYTNSI